MAVEAAHLLPTIPMMMIGNIDIQSDGIDRLGYRTAHPTIADPLIPMYSVFTNPDPLKADSGVTYNFPASRKRSRDFSSLCTSSGAPIDRRASLTFLGEDLSSQIQQQQFEIDQFIASQSEKVRTEMEERRRRNSVKLISALEERVTQRLKAKEEEVMKMAKLNLALEDKVKSLCIENQIWRELAQTNEATANALRSSLKQVLEQVVDGGYRQYNTATGDDNGDDAESCCGSNNGNERMLAEQDSGKSSTKRLCKRCGDAESCVLLLPCRHLCLCTVCVSCVDNCPICKSAKNISVHVHMS